MIADMRAQQENEQALKEQELNAAQAQLMARQQEAEQQGSRLKEAAVSFACSPFLQSKHVTWNSSSAQGSLKAIKSY